MKKIVSMLLMTCILLLIVPVSSAFAASPILLTSGMFGTLSYDLGQDYKIDSNTSDGDDTTYLTMSPDGQSKEVFVYRQPALLNITGYRIKADAGNFDLIFYDSNYNIIKRLQPPVVTGIQQNFTQINNIYQINLFHRGTTSPKVFEVEFFGEVQTPPSPKLSGSINNNVITLNWTPGMPSNKLKYTIYRNSEPIATISGNLYDTHSYIDSNITEGITYTYYVTATETITSSKTSLPSNIITFSPTIQRPINPSDLVAIGGESKVDLSWSPINNASSYNIKRATTPSGPYTTIATSVTQTTYKDTTVTNGITYYYVATAVNAAGESGNSNETSATPMGSKRTILTITMTNGIQQEFNLSKSEFDSYVSWFDTKSNGTGSTKYTFDNQSKKGLFSTRKNSVVFDKIMKYDYDEYVVDGTQATIDSTPEITSGVNLTLTLVDGSQEEFVLSNDEYNAFTSWYDAKSNGTGLARYTFENPHEKAPFLNRSNVVIFDKITNIDTDTFGN
ncbi:fibronectin type III domain-containing protein [Paenibacillus ferrarius]|uniref:fibronectin type III domain-containing protein n=1 Tax=Paenibacillus ferrarius TaxID=1469647 RepID=UPI003D2CA8CF